MEKDKKTGAIRKEDGAKAPDSPADEVPGGAAVTNKAPVVDPKKAKKAVTDKAYKDKKKLEKLDAEKVEAEAAAKCGYFVAEGKAITSKKGIVAGGDRVTVAHWDEATLKKLVESGAVKEIK